MSTTHVITQLETRNDPYSRTRRSPRSTIAVHDGGTVVLAMPDLITPRGQMPRRVPMPNPDCAARDSIRAASRRQLDDPNALFAMFMTVTVASMDPKVVVPRDSPKTTQVISGAATPRRTVPATRALAYAPAHRHLPHRVKYLRKSLSTPCSDAHLRSSGDPACDSARCSRIFLMP